MAMSMLKEVGERKFYQTLLTVSFAVNTGHRYHFILRLLLYVYILDFLIPVSNIFFNNICVVRW